MSGSKTQNVIIAICATMIAACAVSPPPAEVVNVPLVAKFSDFNEVAYGIVAINTRTGDSDVKVITKNSGLLCAGPSKAILNPYNSCTGQQGAANLKCSDGREVSANWVGHTCTSGVGHGKDQNGARFTFAFGVTESVAIGLIDRLSAEVASLPDLPEYRPKEVRKERGYSTGTGFFVSSRGHFVTNFHVIDGASEIAVIWRGAEYVAKLLRTDPANDLALVKLEATTPYLPIRSASHMKRADDVFTLGYPLIAIQGQTQKATFGRVNALTGIQDDIRFLQVDTPIQPGNSGGPLFDNKGSVVGVVTATLDQLVTLKQSGALPQNVNFAVKADYLIPMLSDVAAPITNPDVKKFGLADAVAASEDAVGLVVAK